ncbi:MAG: type VI secretion system baseplate subunit TssG [Planctomycetota bacterium]
MTEERSTPERVDAASWQSRLANEPWKWDVFAALRVSEREHTDLPRLGTSRTPSQDALRLGQEPSFAFPPSTVASFEPADIPRLAVYFFGLFGPNGPLPLHLTEYARDRIRRASDPTFARFVDQFHHRFLSLLYRSWASSRPVIHYDRPEDDRFSIYVGSTMGIASPSMEEHDELSDRAKRYLSGLLSMQSKSSDSLERVLAAFFQVESQVEQFVGQWIELPEEYWCRLGASEETGCLGTTLLLGERFWDCQQKFRVILGPMSYSDYCRMLDEKRRDRLVAIVRNFLGFELQWDLKLVLRKEEIPPCQLGESVRLGWTTWLTTRERPVDGDELIVNPERLARSRQSA